MLQNPLIRLRFALFIYRLLKDFFFSQPDSNKIKLINYLKYLINLPNKLTNKYKII